MGTQLAIIDGQPLVAHGLARITDQHKDIKIVGEAVSAEAAVALIAERHPNVVTVDTVLPDSNGLDLVQELRHRHPGLGIVVLASVTHEEMLLQSMETGASAYVTKTAPITEVIAAIRHAAAAPLSFTASGLAAALGRRRAGQFLLSRRESEVLLLLKDGLSIAAIAQAMHLSHSTAKTYVSRLYEKLGAANRAQALMAAIRLGLIDFDRPTLGNSPEPPAYGIVPGIQTSRSA